MMNLMKKFLNDESGATMVEYAVLVALIAVAAISVIYLVGVQVDQAFEDVKGCLENSASCTAGS